MKQNKTEITIQITPAQSPERTDRRKNKSPRDTGSKPVAHSPRQSSGGKRSTKQNNSGFKFRTPSSNHLSVNNFDISASSLNDDNADAGQTGPRSEERDQFNGDCLEVPKPRKSSLRTRSLGDIFEGVPIHVRFKLTNDNSKKKDFTSPVRRCRSTSPFADKRRGDMPSGSDSFQQIMYEMQSESEADRTDSNSSEEDEKDKNNDDDDDDDDNRNDYPGNFSSNYEKSLQNQQMPPNRIITNETSHHPFSENFVHS